MTTPIPYPNILQGTAQQQIDQLRSYLFVLVGELNAALEALEGGAHGEQVRA